MVSKSEQKVTFASSVFSAMLLTLVEVQVFPLLPSLWFLLKTCEIKVGAIYLEVIMSLHLRKWI